jgi:hypothetical protein
MQNKLVSDCKKRELPQITLTDITNRGKLAHHRHYKYNDDCVIEGVCVSFQCWYCVCYAPSPPRRMLNISTLFLEYVVFLAKSRMV